MVGSETSRKGQDFEKIFIPSIGSQRERLKPDTLLILSWEFFSGLDEKSFENKSPSKL